MSMLSMFLLIMMAMINELILKIILYSGAGATAGADVSGNGNSHDAHAVYVDAYHDVYGNQADPKNFRFLSKIKTEQLYFLVLIGLRLMLVGLEIATICW